MNQLNKYILFVFLIENLLISTKFSLGVVPFYIMLGLGSLMLLQPTFWQSKTMKECAPLYWLGAVYILYQFTLGFSTFSIRSILYLVTKLVTFAIITVSVTSDWDFYARKTPLILSIIIIIVLLTGAATTGDLNSGDRMRLGFGNENLMGSLASLCFAGVLFFWDRKRSFLYALLLAGSTYSLLASGSRNAILYLFIILVIWTGFKISRLIPVILLSVVFSVALSYLPIHLSGVDRFRETVEGNMGSTRDVEREATLMMIKESPIKGWGFEAQNVGQAAMLSELGSHNGYLDTIKFMGYPFGILWFMVLLFSVIPLLKYTRDGQPLLRYHIAIVLSTMITAFFEGWFTGVHQYNTNIMFYSLAVLSTYRARQSYSMV